MEIKTEADSNDITECPHDGGQSIGMFGFHYLYPMNEVIVKPSNESKRPYILLLFFISF